MQKTLKCWKEGIRKLNARKDSLSLVEYYSAKIALSEAALSECPALENYLGVREMPLYSLRDDQLILQALQTESECGSDSELRKVLTPGSLEDEIICCEQREA